MSVVQEYLAMTVQGKLAATDHLFPTLLVSSHLILRPSNTMIDDSRDMLMLLTTDTIFT